MGSFQGKEKKAHSTSAREHKAASKAAVKRKHVHKKGTTQVTVDAGEYRVKVKVPKIAGVKKHAKEEDIKGSQVKHHAKEVKHHVKEVKNDAREVKNHVREVKKH